MKARRRQLLVLQSHDFDDRGQEVKIGCGRDRGKTVLPLQEEDMNTKSLHMLDVNRTGL